MVGKVNRRSQQEQYCLTICVTRAPLLHLSKSVSCQTSVTPDHIFIFSIYKGINTLYWPNNNNYHLIVTQYRQVLNIAVLYWPSTQDHHHLAPLSHLDLVFLMFDRLKSFHTFVYQCCLLSSEYVEAIEADIGIGFPKGLIFSPTS